MPAQWWNIFAWPESMKIAWTVFWLVVLFGRMIYLGTRMR